MKELALPFHIKPLGTVAAEEDPLRIYGQHIRTIIHTGLRERVMRPAYGTTAWATLFEPINDVSLTLLETSIRDAILRFEPNVELGAVVVHPVEEGSSEIRVEVTYRVGGVDARAMTEQVTIDVGGDISVTTGAFG